jgi:hypothetical protein
MKNSPFISVNDAVNAKNITARQRETLVDMVSMVDDGVAGVIVRTAQDALDFAMRIEEEDVAAIDIDKFFSSEIAKAVSGVPPEGVKPGIQQILAVIRVYTYNSLLMVLSRFNGLNSDLLSGMASVGIYNVKPTDLIDCSMTAIYSSEAGATATKINIKINRELMDSINSAPLFFIVNYLMTQLNKEFN